MEFEGEREGEGEGEGIRTKNAGPMFCPCLLQPLSCVLDTSLVYLELLPL